MRIFNKLDASTPALTTVLLLQSVMACRDLGYLVRTQAGGAAFLVWAAALAAILTLQFVYIFPGARRIRNRHHLWIVAALACAAFLPLGVLGVYWEGSCGIFTGFAVLALRSHRSRRIASGLLCAGWLTAWSWDLGPPDAKTSGFYLLLPAVTVASVLYLSEVIARLKQKHHAIARKAAHDERLRISRDLHDLLAGKLTTVVLQGELVLRLSKFADDPPESELRAMVELARSTLAEVRSIAGQYRATSLSEEIATSLSILMSAGIEVTEETEGTDQVDSDAAQILIPVVREAVVNLLRHSRATQCRFEFRRNPDSFRFSLANDGAPTAYRRNSGEGSGLPNLVARLNAAGGTLVAERCEEDWFVLTAELPRGAAAHTPAPAPPAARASRPPSPSGRRPAGSGRPAC